MINFPSASMTSRCSLDAESMMAGTFTSPATRCDDHGGPSQATRCDDHGGPSQLRMSRCLPRPDNHVDLGHVLAIQRNHAWGKQAPILVTQGMGGRGPLNQTPMVLSRCCLLLVYVCAAEPVAARNSRRTWRWPWRRV
jgi:hypothetical protein